MAPHPFGPGRSGTPVARPLVVSARTEFLDDVLRLAAAADVEVDVVPDVVSAHTRWAAAPLVLVDDATLTSGGEDSWVALRRPGVVLLSGREDDPTLWRRAVDVGADQVLFPPDVEARVAEQLAEARDGAARSAYVVAVVGGRGGAGASTLAAALAVTAVSRGSRVMLVDLDPLGGGIDLVLGVEGASGLRWGDLAAARGRLNGASLTDALPRVGELPVLSWDRGSDVSVPFDAARSVIEAAVRACDVVVIDLPRACGDAAAHAAGRADDLFVVVPAEVRAVAAAERVLRSYKPLARSVRAVVRGPAPSGLEARAVGEALKVEVAGELRAEPRLAQALERGEPPAHRGRGPLATWCSAQLDAVGR